MQQAGLDADGDQRQRDRGGRAECDAARTQLQRLSRSGAFAVRAHSAPTKLTRTNPPAAHGKAAKERPRACVGNAIELRRSPGSAFALHAACVLSRVLAAEWRSADRR
jgi:hypothetical protein